MRVVVTGNTGTALLRALEREPAVEEVVGIAGERMIEGPPQIRLRLPAIRESLPLIRQGDRDAGSQCRRSRRDARRRCWSRSPPRRRMPSGAPIAMRRRRTRS